ncbi:hypothetical protein KSB_62240 [Ktedonobacter robiniae]|uniref:Uncharacterized protein n=1 Tax=Ktedonobacter robiniae TaxID=2778365 RepID=A0ABQ3UXY9_9CHLR|nr:hypothetical protein KSB_62240 [Ktedonobacter robiniae]
MHEQRQDESKHHTRQAKEEWSPALLAFVDMVIAIASSTYSLPDKEERNERNTEHSNTPPEQRVEDIRCRCESDKKKGGQGNNLNVLEQPFSLNAHHQAGYYNM